MDGAGSAVGIASLGIQVCQGLLSYYGGWKGYKGDIANAYTSITDLRETFGLLADCLRSTVLDPDRSRRVEECLRSCEGSLHKLEEKLHKLQGFHVPSGSRRKAYAELQRVWYPLYPKTLGKLRGIVEELQGRLSIALQVLQLASNSGSQHTLTQVEAYAKDTSARTIAIEGSLAHLSTQNEHILAGQQADQFRKIVDWISPPDPWTNHASARRHHEPQTGDWLLQSDQYKRWRGGQARHLWLYGKAGCGKTVLSSTVIEDVRLYCKSTANAGLAIFYFSFSDNRKQSFESLLCSLVAQLGWKEPGRSMLQREYDKPNRSLPGAEALEEILISSISQYDEVFLALDALDECPESEDARRDMLGSLERLSKRAANLRIFATSRELRDIHDRIESLQADVISVGTCPVDADIGTYVSSELSRDKKLNRLEGSTKTLIMETFAEKANGMCVSVQRSYVVVLMSTTIQVQMGILPASGAEEAQIYQTEIRKSGPFLSPCNFGCHLRADVDRHRRGIARRGSRASSMADICAITSQSWRAR